MTHSFSNIDRAALAEQTFSRVYRLALLVTGDQNAAADLSVHTFAVLSDDASKSERELARGLITNGRPSAKRGRVKWQPDSVAIDRAGIRSDAATKLFAVCWNASPAARLLLGLHTLWGLTPAEAADIAGQPVELLLDLRIEATIALALVPDDADRATVATLARMLAGILPPDEASAARGLLLSDETVRALRDGLLEGEQAVRRVLPIVFATPPPDDLFDRIEQAMIKTVGRKERPTRQIRRLSPTVKLTGAVLLLIVALLLTPMVWSWGTNGRGATSSALKSPRRNWLRLPSIASTSLR